ncbi:SMI1/KNR4 family protein [Actinoplanes sp. NPDC049802]|uniref:SMI1/KNR4 family protein n=1 Tax=Actinoplanes sp. NPDC049802 TaxID=3154742 RepID=UPI0033F8D1D7
MPGDETAAFAQWRRAVTSADENTEPPVAWADFESSLGLRLPADYKAYIDEYGVGFVNRLFVVRHPTTTEAGFNLLQAPEQWEAPDAEQEYLETHLTAPPLPLGIGRDRLMLCADSDGTQIYWDTSQDDPDSWSVVVGDDDGDTWQALDLTLVETLLQLFTGRLPELGFDQAGYVTGEIRIQRNPFART